MKLIIGSDHAGFLRKEEIKEYLIKKGYEVEDVGCFSQDSVDYPLFGFEVGKKVANKEGDYGIVVCYSGIGISIAANKIKGIRCANVTELEQVELCRQHNNANVLSIGAHFVSKEKAFELVDKFLSTSFEGGRHARRVSLLDEG